MGAVRLMLGDDHTVVRKGLKKILEGHEEWKVVGEAANGRDAVRLAIAIQPDVTVLE
jgi:DNA-binding NarL/FixJ family response regulator